MYRGTYDSWGCSELDQIDTTNASRLVPVWTFSTGMREGHQAPPQPGDGSRCAYRRSALALRARPTRRPVPDAPDEPWRRAVRRARVSGDGGRLPGGTRRQDRGRRLGARGRGLHRGLLHDAGPDGCQGQGHGRRLRRRVRDPGLRRGVRRRERRARVEDLHDPGTGRAGQRDLERSQLEDGRRSRLDHGLLRPGPQPDLLGHRQRRTLDGRHAARRQSVCDLRDRARHRRAPSPPPVPLERFLGLG